MMYFIRRRIVIRNFLLSVLLFFQRHREKSREKMRIEEREKEKKKENRA